MTMIRIVKGTAEAIGADDEYCCSIDAYRASDTILIPDDWRPDGGLDVPTHIPEGMRWVFEAGADAILQALGRIK
jgi:hypothetical protein